VPAIYSTPTKASTPKLRNTQNIRSRKAEKQKSRKAEKQKSRKAEKQKSREILKDSIGRTSALPKATGR